MTPKPAKKTQNPHDRLFRHVFSNPEHARGQLQRMLPPRLLKVIDWPTLKLEPGSYVDTKLKEFASDLLFSAKLVRNKRRAFVYLLFEHQRKPDEWMAVRFLNYASHAWMDYIMREKPEDGYLPKLVPMLMYQGAEPWKESTTLAEYHLRGDEPGPGNAPDPGDELEDFIDLKFLVYDLSADTLHGAKELSVMARVTLSLMQQVASGKSTVQEAALTARWLSEVWERYGWDEFRPLAEYIYSTQQDDQTFDAIVGNVSKPMQEELMSYGERLEARGVTKGRAEQTLKLLGLRFGELPNEIRRRVESASVDELDRWTERLLTADSLTKIFDP